MVKMVDTSDLSSDATSMRVRLPLWAPFNKRGVNMKQLHRFAWETKAYYYITEDCRYDMPKGGQLKKLARKIKRNRYKQMTKEEINHKY